MQPQRAHTPGPPTCIPLHRISYVFTTRGSGAPLARARRAWRC